MSDRYEIVIVVNVRGDLPAGAVLIVFTERADEPQ